MSEQTPVQVFHAEERRTRYRRGGFFIKTGLLCLLVLIPFLFPSYKTVDLAMKVIIYAALVASFDLSLIHI